MFESYYLPTIRHNEAETKEATQTITKCVSDPLEAFFPTAAKDGEEPREHPLYLLGSTKIFFRHGVLVWLAELRKKKLGMMIISVKASAHRVCGRHNGASVIILHLIIASSHQ